MLLSVDLFFFLVVLWFELRTSHLEPCLQLSLLYWQVDFWLRKEENSLKTFIQSILI
jgi:hypothetical protein